MIEDLVSIHDRFSVEIKLGFIAPEKLDISDFAVNTWIFVPDSLDINRDSYDKTDFYRDLKSNIRLITPAYLLSNIAVNGNAPFSLMEKSFDELASHPSPERISAYEYHIRMFVSIVKSALRTEINQILKNASAENMDDHVSSFIGQVKKITNDYRNLGRIINVPSVGRELLKYYLFGDEFLSNLIEQHCFKLAAGIGKTTALSGPTRAKLLDLINAEVEYKRRKEYPVVEKDSPNKNRDLVFRLALLKKYAENELFLNTSKRRDGILIEQIYLSIAAGISMVFATAIAFSFQQRFGNFTMPFFVAIIVGYILKDRIKELLRFYYAHRLSKRFFDHRTDVSLSGHGIGWSKESMDFIPETKVPPEVIRIRNRSDILEAENRNKREKIILYRRLVRLNRKELDKWSRYPVKGINDVIRFNISQFTQKMDNPEIPLFITGADNSIGTVKGEKIYYINLLFQFRNDGQTDYKRYRIVLNREGIKEIENF